MHLPSSTYRIQFHRDFTFKDLQRLLDYLHTLGITTIYASPVMKATPASMHGYDVTDPHVINPEIGTVEELATISRELNKRSMRWIQDIVPNHMAFHPMNYRLMDVLERGPYSRYYNYFDIDWSHPNPALTGKVMVPFLGNEWSTCLDHGDISIRFSQQGFTLNYLENAYPLSMCAYPLLRTYFEKLGDDSMIPVMLDKMEVASHGIDYETWYPLKQEFLQGIRGIAVHEEIMERVLGRINKDRQALQALADAQYYRLCYWKMTDTTINYRRFFTVNELICLRMEDEKVFDEYHQYLLSLYRDKVIHGFRIDHIDGLQDPARYTRDLRKAMGETCYIIAEKILEAKEEMPAHWPIQGTSGYEFLSFLNQLLTYRKGARELLNFYQELLPDIPPYKKLIYESKKLILENYMVGEWDNLVRLLRTLNLAANFDEQRVKRALGLFMLFLPVYRIYPDGLPLKGKSLLTIHAAFDQALKEDPELADELNHLSDLFTNSPATEEEHHRILLFLRRLMQFTGPLTAKGVEDTTFYIYNPLISHDEVGSSPSPLGISIQSFHDKMRIRQSNTPLSLNATATHDTKRGEDARVRINVLSRIPGLWKKQLQYWLDINSCCRTTVNGRTVPELNDEYFIYQSMLGGFPEDYKVDEAWVMRVQSYLNKALREAKVNTNWTEPDEQYEKACEQFVARILKGDHIFLSSFVPFVKTVCEHAMVYSLSQTLIKLTAPGIPDIYQGCELWDLSFVDPDNRRPVDYEKRMAFLFQLVIKAEKGKVDLFDYLHEHREAGIEKLYLIWKTLNYRKTRPLLFTEGDYIPLSITGEEATAVAYARNRKEAWAIIVIPLGLVKHDIDSMAEKIASQYLVLPENAPVRWLNILTGDTFEVPNQIPLVELFRDFPVALLVADCELPAANT